MGQAIAAASRDPPGPRQQPAPCTASPAAADHPDRQHNTEGGPDRVDPGADERGAAEGRGPAVFARAAAITSQADEAVEVVDAALDHSSHRDRAGGRGITVSFSATGKATRNLVQELQKTVDELAGTPGRPTRSNGGQHHAVVTPHVEASPDRSDFAKLGETIAASLVQAQEHANHASVFSNRPSSPLTTFDPMGEGVDLPGPRSRDHQPAAAPPIPRSPVLDRTPLLRIKGFESAVAVRTLGVHPLLE